MPDKGWAAINTITADLEIPVRHLSITQDTAIFSLSITKNESVPARYGFTILNRTMPLYFSVAIWFADVQLK